MQFSRLYELIHESTIFDEETWYHGSASGDLTKAWRGIHLGTYKAAQQALHATIGFPVEGEWDGKREYGKTLLCGKKSILQKDRHGITGFNCDIPEEDFYAPCHGKQAHYGSFSVPIPIPCDVFPAIRGYRIICPMRNTKKRAYTDNWANMYMSRLKKRGGEAPREGLYYINDGEDAGKISVVVPDHTCLQEVQ